MKRGPQVLQLLFEQGPLSIRSMQTLIEPQISRRRLHAVVTRLVDKGLVLKRFNDHFYSVRQFYELPQSNLGRKRVAEMLDVYPDELIQTHFRNQELFHSEQCAVWAEYLKHLYPEANVVRDFRIRHYPKLERLFLKLDQEPTIIPDILISFPPEAGKYEIHVAFEVELSRKTDRRLRQKINKYSKGTHVDGVVYICGEDSLLALMSRQFQKHFTAKSLRVGHYKNNFFLAGLNNFCTERKEPRLLNLNEESVSLRQWVHTLRSTKANERRDSMFK